jgi:hypothetical protein
MAKQLPEVSTLHLIPIPPALQGGEEGAHAAGVGR